MTLPLLGGMIFGIFGKVAVGAGFLDRRDHLGALDGLEPAELLREHPVPLGQHRHLLDRRHHSTLRKNYTRAASASEGRPHVTNLSGSAVRTRII
jgi:hypothetical protein